jgi:2,3-bisphosphoglycerate-dependent phosphoglycerate mutase
MKKYIYLFRHGTTTDNAAGKFSGFRDVSLNKRGFDDAKIVALRLKEKEFTVAFQSRLKRSKQTLKEVLKFHPECRVIMTDNRIIERDYGAVSGKTHYDYIKKNSPEKYDKFHRGYPTRPPKGESVKDVEKRIKPFIRDLLKLIKEKKINVAISAHGNSMRPLRRYFEKLSIKEMMLIENPYDDVFIYEVKV